MTRLNAGILFGIALLAAGCASSPPAIVPVEGVVLLDGKPLPNAEVQFVPMIQGFGAEYIAVGTTDEQGRFKLTCNNGQPGGCACENRVTVTDPPTPEEFRGQSEKAQIGASQFLANLKNRPIPQKYATVGESELRVDVKQNQTEYKIELTRSAVPK